MADLEQLQKDLQKQEEIKIEEHIIGEPQHMEVPQQINEGNVHMEAPILAREIQANAQAQIVVPQDQVQVQQEQIVQVEETKREKKQREKVEAQQRKEKELRKKQREQNMTAAKQLVDEETRIALSNPETSNYNELAPTVNYVESQRMFERMILDKVQDERVKFQLYDRIRTLQSMTTEWQKARHIARYRSIEINARLIDKGYKHNAITEVLCDEMEKTDEQLEEIIRIMGEIERDLVIAMHHEPVEIDGVLNVPEVICDLPYEEYEYTKDKNIPRALKEQEEEFIAQYIEANHCQAFEAKVVYRELFITMPMVDEEFTYLESMRKCENPDLKKFRKYTEMDVYKNIYNRRHNLANPATLRGYEFAHKNIQMTRQAMSKESGLKEDGYLEEISKKIGIPKEEVKYKLDKSVETIMKHIESKSAYNIRIPNTDILSKILQGGRFKSQMETGTSCAELDAEQRKDFAQQNLGANVAAMSPSDYEIYGYMSSSDKLKEFSYNGGKNSCGTAQYGNLIVTLKKDRMKDRTTFSLGDSLSLRFRLAPTKLTAPNSDALNVLDTFYPEQVVKMAEKIDSGADVYVEADIIKKLELLYLELQYHGGVTIDDIESITMVTNYNNPQLEDVVKNMEQDYPEDLLKELKILGIKTFKNDGDTVSEV